MSYAPCGEDSSRDGILQLHFDTQKLYRVSDAMYR